MISEKVKLEFLIQGSTFGLRKITIFCNFNSSRNFKRIFGVVGLNKNITSGLMSLINLPHVFL